MSVRSTAKAIIIHNDKILLNKCYDKNNGHYYSLPGGGQEKYEKKQVIMSLQFVSAEYAKKYVITMIHERIILNTPTNYIIFLSAI